MFAGEIQKSAIVRSLTSIAKHGLLPLSAIPKDEAWPNPTLSIQDVLGSICVSCVDLRDASAKEKQEALETAVYEEYCGIHGISLERQWPLSQAAEPNLATLEISQRLQNAVVFILKPPTLLPRKGIVRGGNIKINVANYHAEDGFSQAQMLSKPLMSDKKVTSVRISEIKTRHCFSCKEILEILVPEPLFEVANPIFSKLNIRVTPVSMAIMPLQKLPQILNRLHGERLVYPCPLLIPKFEEALAKLSYNHFSVHTVRLHTPFDFAPRYMANIKGEEKSIDLFKGKTAIQYPDQSGWLLAHKSIAYSAKNTITKLTACLDGDKIKDLERAQLFQESCYKKLIDSKGKNLMLMVYRTKPLASGQLTLLKHQAKVIEFMPNCYAISCLPDRKQCVRNIIENFDPIQTNAAIKIQTLFRAYRARKLIAAYKIAQQKVTQLRTELASAEKSTAELARKLQIS